MGRAPCCSKVGLHRGPWTPREDTLLVKDIQALGEGHCRSLPKKADRILRWMNYLRPDIKRRNIAPDEDDLIIRLHSLLGNRRSLIARRLPGRTDNEIKNYWNTHLSKRLLSQGTDPNTHKNLPHQVVVQAVKFIKRKKPVVLVTKSSTMQINRLTKKNPKSISANPTSISLPRNETCPNTPSSQGEVHVPWSDYVNDDENRTGFLSGYYDNNDHGFIKGSDFECKSHHEHHHHVPAATDQDDTNSLEKLYEEYLQLLKTNEDPVQLDSFAESLLI